MCINFLFYLLRGVIKLYGICAMGDNYCLCHPALRPTSSAVAPPIPLWGTAPPKLCGSSLRGQYYPVCPIKVLGWNLPFQCQEEKISSFARLVQCDSDYPKLVQSAQGKVSPAPDHPHSSHYLQVQGLRATNTSDPLLQM